VIHAIEAAAGRQVSRETFDRIGTYVALLKEESQRQNLVSAATLEAVWERHILDSAQLLRFQPNADASWVDIGSGAGLPGIVLACLTDGPVTLVEPRRLRAEFLHKLCESLQLNARVVVAKAERAEGRFDTITGRAVASMGKFFEISQHLSTGKCLWVLPKGRTARDELAEAQRSWQGVFHVEPSVTDPESFIVVGTGVGAKQ
jgi:16S rRNA (guanine527-N7)-methyltransferase